MHRPIADRRLRAPADEGTPAAALLTSPAAGEPPAPGGNPPNPAAGGEAAKWWQDEKLFDADTQTWLTARGLTKMDNPLEALPKIVQGHRAAEARIGKGLDSIIDRPAKDQPWGDWARANAEALGLPADAAAYEVKPPEDWPKDLPWDSAAEAAVREIAFKHGVPPEAHKAYVAFQANAMKEMAAQADAGFAEARTKMMTDLQRDYGDQLQAKIAGAQQAMQFMAEKAGFTPDGIKALSLSLSEKTGDAGVIKLFATLSDLMADDSGLSMGRGQQTLGMTPADAKAELARFEGPDGEYGKAFAAGDAAQIAALRARREQLYKVAAGG